LILDNFLHVLLHIGEEITIDSQFKIDFKMKQLYVVFVLDQKIIFNFTLKSLKHKSHDSIKNDLHDFTKNVLHH